MQWGKYGIIDDNEWVHVDVKIVRSASLLTSCAPLTSREKKENVCRSCLLVDSVGLLELTNLITIQEFRSWMIEERKINPETVKKDTEKKEWTVFVEDYNTGRSSFILTLCGIVH